MAAVVYGAWVRHRLMRWVQATRKSWSVSRPRNSAPHGKRGPTMAVTINAPPDRVWPWLVELGGDRGGWYPWDDVDNAGRPSAREIHLTEALVGDTFKYWTRRRGPVDTWTVEV